MSGFGLNSEIRMPEWAEPWEITLQEGTNRGTLSDNILINSTNLGYDIHYKVYTPYGYDNLDNLPVVYVTDGHEYADDEMGSMVIVLDNLIHQNLTDPVMAVFIDPREPGNPSNNRRAEQYLNNPLFANFVADELVPEIDANYKTSANPQERAIMGTSYGGNCAAYFGAYKPDVFKLLIIHSPAFQQGTFNLYADSEAYPLNKIYMSTGLICDTENLASQMKTIFNEKDYAYQYAEVNQGHSWGNWRGLIDEPLMYFFTTGMDTEHHSMEKQTAIDVYPNPAGKTINIHLKKDNNSIDKINLIDVTGKVVKSFNQDLSVKQSLHIGYLKNGVYFLEIISCNIRFCKTIIIHKSF